MMSSNHLPFSPNLGLQVQFGNKATVFSVEEPIISAPEGQISLFQSADCFFSIHGIVHYEFVLKGETVNQHFYSCVLRHLWENVQ
jgi:hypothetical protein